MNKIYATTSSLRH